MSRQVIRSHAAGPLFEPVEPRVLLSVALAGPDMPNSLVLCPPEPDETELATVRVASGPPPSPAKDEALDVAAPSLLAVQPPDLVPYKPDFWNDRIPIGLTPLKASDAHSYTGPYYDTQTLYFNWASANQGEATAVGYAVRVEVTGVGGDTWNWPDITTESGWCTWLDPDLEVGPLSEGPHTFKLWLDYTNVVDEGAAGEDNNYYERTITVLPGGAKPDLVPYRPDVWNDVIPIGTKPLAGTDAHTYSGPYYADEPLYFNRAYANLGCAPASAFAVHLEITGAGGATWDWPNDTMPQNQIGFLKSDQYLGVLGAGEHTFRLCVDYTNTVDEGPGEDNNYYERTITVLDRPSAYQFERMWPTLQQPWYFDHPNDVAVDRAGFVYVVERTSRRIQKFTADGQFVVNWGSWGSGEGQFGEPYAAASADGFVYVADAYRDCVLKFTADGQFVREWGRHGSAEGEFDRPVGIAADPSGFVYVTDMRNNRIQKFTADGQFVAQWGTSGAGEGQFKGPCAIEASPDGFVYVTDVGNKRVQKFTCEGGFVTEWGGPGPEDGQFQDPAGIAVDASGFVYVADHDQDRIQEFTSDGQFVKAWGTFGRGTGQFAGAAGLAVDGRGVLYVSDEDNLRIQEFSLDGEFLDQWGSQGTGNGGFFYPADVALSGSHLYVADYCNNLVQEFTIDGQFVKQWGQAGSGPGQFAGPIGLAFDSGGNIYVVQENNHCVQEFTADGAYVTQWGTPGSGEGQFSWPSAVAIDAHGNVYVCDTGNNRIEKFTADGQFVAQWGTPGAGEGQFQDPAGIAVDASGYVYVADAANYRVQRFKADGEFDCQWGSQGSADGQFAYLYGIAADRLGSVYVSERNRVQVFTSTGDFVAKLGVFSVAGSQPGQFNGAAGMAIDADGRLYIADALNNRIQRFRPVRPDTGVAKAIVVAGGGAFPGNNIWDATQMNANFAYRALTYQGFTKETIYYLTSDTDLDLDNNGVPDDVDGDATCANLKQAITNWAADADSVVVYLVDHGGTGTFRMSGTETLAAANLDDWLDALQAQIPGRLIVIYDACKSGSFLPALSHPEGDKQRIVAASSAADQSAYFVTNGSISFSNFFWTQVFNGLDLADAFILARQAISGSLTQMPQLDADGDGLANEAADLEAVRNIWIGSGTCAAGLAPQIGGVSPDQTIPQGSAALVYAYNVTDDDGIARVWAVVRPPDWTPGASGNPVVGFPSFDLAPVAGNRWEATYAGFSIPGTYQVAIYARDRAGNTCAPQITMVTASHPLTHKAVVVAGGPSSDAMWPSIEKNVQAAYQALRFQGYKDDDIYLLSPVGLSGVDGTPCLSNVEYALTTWAVANTEDVTVYLVGGGGAGTFRLSATETLAAADLDGWLDALQNQIPAKVTVVYDACQSGSFLPALAPPAGMSRILISSVRAGESAGFLSGGDVSFSKFFWNGVLNGANVRDAFRAAASAMAFASGQTAQLDDNGNGIGNEKADGQMARQTVIGSGIMLGGDAPLVGSVSPPQTLHGETPATLWADVTTTGTIERVWAILTPPQYAPAPGEPVTDLPTVDLIHTSGNRYEGTLSGFDHIGTYDVAIYAMDAEGNVSQPQSTAVQQTVGADEYEDDNTCLAARPIVIGGNPQAHNFYASGDEDWVKFYGLAGTPYAIETSDPGPRADTVIELYDSDGETLLLKCDAGGAGEGESTDWLCPTDGMYYVRVRSWDPAVFGPRTDYQLQVFIPGGQWPGFITGVVRDAVTQAGIAGAVVTAMPKGTEVDPAAAVTNSDGVYQMCLVDGIYAVKVSAKGYVPKTIDPVTVPSTGLVTLDVALGPSAAPEVVSVELNNRPGRSVGSVDPSGTGVRTIAVRFTKPVTFAQGSVTVQRVAFPSGVEAVLGPLTPSSVKGSGTNTMTIELAACSAVDVWVKINLKSNAIADLTGNNLDGETPIVGSRRPYLYSAALDLPSGNAEAGGDAVFYVGSLQGDFRGVGFGATVPDRQVTPSDIDGFIAAYNAGGTDWGVDPFLSAYSRAVDERRHLDPLPNPGPPLAQASGPLGGVCGGLEENVAAVGAAVMQDGVPLPVPQAQPDPATLAASQRQESGEVVALLPPADGTPDDATLPLMSGEGLATDAATAIPLASIAGRSSDGAGAGLTVRSAAPAQVPLASGSEMGAAVFAASEGLDNGGVDLLVLPPLEVPLGV
jgi:hypothetical protein